MAIEDGLVLADELASGSEPEAAFEAFRARRFDRTRFIAMNSVRIGDSQMGKIEHVDVAALNRETIGLMAQPI